MAGKTKTPWQARAGAGAGKTFSDDHVTQRGEASEPPAGIAFMITNRVKTELGELGYTREQIADLQPEEAHEILAGRRKEAQSVRQFATPVEITCLTKSGGPLTKTIKLAPGGSVMSELSACVMGQGKARRVHIADVGQLAALIDRLQSNEAIALGALRSDLPDQVEIVTKRMPNGAKPRVIARTGDNIVFSSGRPALALLDFDTKGMPHDVSERLDQAGGFWPALISVVPGLSNVARVTRSSTSAGLFRDDTGERLPGSTGLHVYLLVQDGTDIGRFLKTLHDRCWLAGFGWTMVGAGGQLLERSIVDRMVGAPERLVFEGPPVLEPPLQQEPECRRPIVFDGEALDTISACRPLTILETSNLNELRAKEANRLASESARTRAAFISRQTERLVERTGMATHVEGYAVARWCDGVLLPDVVLPFDDQDFEGATVGDVLADPFRFEGATLADPLEGVGYGRCKAKVMLRPDGTPWIHSFAHGRAIYGLRLDGRAIRAGIEKAPDQTVVDTFVKLALAADLDPVEWETLVDYTAQRARIGVRAVKSNFKAEQQQNEARRAKAREDSRLAERHDPRPQINRPLLDAEWLPQMQVMNDVLGASSAPERATASVPILRSRRLAGTGRCNQAHRRSGRPRRRRSVRSRLPVAYTWPLPHGGTRWPCRALRGLRLYHHLLQQLSQSVE
jgi:hypothetical protein